MIAIPRSRDDCENLVRLYDPGQCRRLQIFLDILARNVAGFRRIEVLRGRAGEEVEFATVMWFDSLESVKAFAGDDCETAGALPKARALLKRFEPRSGHNDVREERSAR